MLKSALLALLCAAPLVLPSSGAWTSDAQDPSTFDAKLPSSPQVSAQDPSLSRRAGLLCTQGVLFTGVLYHGSAQNPSRLTPYRQGRRHGVLRAFFPSGSLAAERPYWEGQKVGLHRGWWAEGGLRFEQRYFQGVYQGVQRTWHAQGQLAQVHRYQAGKEEGLQRGWDARGQILFSYVVREGRRFGILGSNPCFTTRNS